jgi:DNA replication and repair protein RecF
MSLQYLEITNLRNLIQAKVDLGNQFNVFYGLNGSGKTSLLEAIYYLGFGKSFRTRHNHRIIHHEADKFSLFAQVLQAPSGTIKLGIERSKTNEGQVRIQGENVNSLAELTKILPLQIIHPASHRLLTDGPKLRRQFMDLGVFHVEQNFLLAWQRAQRALKQRNAALKQRKPIAQITLWDAELISAANTIDHMRALYIEELKIEFVHILSKLTDIDNISMKYCRGWNENLPEALEQTLHRDIYLGYTQNGPHRADIDLKIGPTPIQDGLSQGQQKLVLYALRLAQGILQQKQTGKTCLFLIDDLPAELDYGKRALIVDVLKELNAQVIITGAEYSELENLTPKESTTMFHVKHGVIERVS